MIVARSLKFLVIFWVIPCVKAVMAMQFQKRRTVVLIGDRGVGKTTLIKRLTKLGKATPTAGPSDVHEVTYKETKIVMVDVGGESVRSVTPNTVRYARVVLLTYDITKHETLDNCKYWHHFARHNCKEEPVSYALVGCKSDLSSNREVAWDTAERVSKMINASKLLEVSETNNTQCDELMDWIYGIMKDVPVEDDMNESIQVGDTTQDTNNSTQRSCWC